MLLGTIASCLPWGDPVTVANAPPKVVAGAPALMAAAREIDITPMPGLPTYGHSSNGVPKAKGYWLRLKGRIVALQEGEQRVVLLQLDLGASSALLHRRLASALTDVGVGPHNLLMATTHTHGGPGAFFGHRFYNRFVGAVPAFEPRFVDWLVQQIGQGVREALSTESLRPAVLAVAQARVDDGATHNRSRPAWKHNFTHHGLMIPEDEVDRMLTLVRVDAVEGGARTPMAAWSVFAAHGTSMPADYPVFHGDVHGVAARLLSTWVRQRHPSAKGFVAAMANGAEGDVAPGVSVHGEPPPQSKGLAMAVGGRIANAAYRAFLSLDDVDDTARALPLRVAYREVSMRGAGTTRGRLCQGPLLGGPQLGGSEEGRGPLYGFLGMYEGAAKPPSGCDATKTKVGGFVQDLIIDELEFPDVVPFQLVAFGERLVLATVPGEPTTEVGREIARRVGYFAASDLAAVVGLSNGYATYFTMPDEFLEQHYEGGATLYGPYQGLFAVEQLEAMAKSLHGDARDSSRISHRKSRTFQPGEAGELWPTSACDPGSWEAGDLELAPGIARFSWTGVNDEQACELPPVDVVCGGTALFDRRGFPQSDEGFAFEVTRKGAATWTAQWQLHAEADDCAIRVHRPGLPALESARFDAKNPQGAQP